MDFVHNRPEGIDRPLLGSLIDAPRVPILGFWTFMEGGGPGIADGSGNGYHGTLANGTWDVAEQGPRVVFNNSSTVINCPSAPSSSRMWWMFRCAPNTVTGVHGVANKYVTSGTDRSWRIHFSDAAVYLQLSSDGTGSEQQSIASAVTINQRQTFLLAFNAGEFRAWRRGSSDDTVAELSAPDFTLTSIFNNSTAVQIGTGNQWFSGSMTFFAMGTGIISHELAVDMIRHPFADFEVADDFNLFESNIRIPRGELTGGFYSMPGGFG